LSPSKFIFVDVSNLKIMFPLVSVITPTTHDRAHFNERISRIFRAQDYQNKEILFDYGKGNVGAKRNKLCSLANGEIILNFDSDDWYAPDWISKSVAALLRFDCDMVGLSTAYFHSPTLNKTWQYVYPENENLHGATLCYRKSFWEKNNYLNMQVGEDSQFVRKAKFMSHGYVDGFISTVHEGNTSPKNISGERWVLVDMLIPELMDSVEVSTV
jgi:cellulose synthase/poly-beta-1,6-N-acetylglucosamine synthase-like glycosyltransferase